MTINGAITQLVMMTENSMMPNIFRPALNKVIETISELEPEPRKKGKWKLRTDERFDIDYYKCSECGYEPYRKMDISNFCPNCGADMREDI